MTAGTSAALLPTRAHAADGGIRGQDVSSHQGEADWAMQKEAGSQLVYCKTTQGNWYTNPFFAQQYGGSYDAGLIHGAYQWTEPGNGDPVAECDYFLENVGGWTDDGRTMPGMVDVEDNPNGLGQQELQDWIVAWIDHYRDQTGRTPVVYTGEWFPAARLPLQGGAPGGHRDPRHLERLGDLAVRRRRGPFAGDPNQFFGDQAQWEALLTDKDYDPVSN